MVPTGCVTPAPPRRCRPGRRSAATFDRALAFAYGSVVGSEARGEGLTSGSARRWISTAPAGRPAARGRGAVPGLAVYTAAQVVAGAKSQDVIATLKHYTAYNQDFGPARVQRRGRRRQVPCHEWALQESTRSRSASAVPGGAGARVRYVLLQPDRRGAGPGRQRRRRASRTAPASTGSWSQALPIRGARWRGGGRRTPALPDRRSRGSRREWIDRSRISPSGAICGCAPG